MRVAAVQFRIADLDTVEQFEARVAKAVAKAARGGADFVLFPELFAMGVLSVGGQALPASEAIGPAADYFPRLLALCERLAGEHAVNLIGGSHPRRMPDGTIRNTCPMVLRGGGGTHLRDKLHITPWERETWGIAPGDGAEPVETDRGPIAVMICYDSEFPELPRHLIDAGALVLFVPYCTEDRRGHLRVRYCCQARTVENQCHVVTAGLVGETRRVEGLEECFAQSAVFSPSDAGFAPDGIAAEAKAAEEAIVFADLSLADLMTARAGGAVRNLADRRDDLYRVEWRGSGTGASNAGGAE